VRFFCDWEKTTAIIPFQWRETRFILAKPFDNIGAVPEPLSLMTVRFTVPKPLCLEKSKTDDRWAN